MIFLSILSWGLLCGWLANVIMGRGATPAEWGPLIAAGIGGSFLGGMALSLINGDGLAIRPSGLIGSVLGAMVVLGVVYSRRGD